MAADEAPQDAPVLTTSTLDEAARKILKLIAYIGRYAAHQEQMETLHSTANPKTPTSRSENGASKQKSGTKDQHKSTVAAVTKKTRNPDRVSAAGRRIIYRLAARRRSLSTGAGRF